MNDIATTDAATRIRRHSIEMVAAARASHLGGSLSLADVLAVLYWDIANLKPEEPRWPDRDRIVLSKGHCCAAAYAALAIRGFFAVEELKTYGQDGSRLMAHMSSDVPGVEFSTGSLGHGLPFGAGCALAAKRQTKPWRTYVMLSDGELDEGSNWEALLFAPHHKLDNLVAIIDYNRIQSLGRVSEVMELEPLLKKLQSFRWAVREIDGHDHDALKAALRAVPWEPGRPSCLIARTTKGRGVTFMEDTLEWHYRSPDADQLNSAIRQLTPPVP